MTVTPMAAKPAQLEKALEEAKETSRKEGNALFYELTKQFLTLGTIIISVSPALAFSIPAFPIISRWPWLYLTALAFALLSLAFGLWQLLHEWRFFRGLAAANALQAAYNQGSQLTKKQIKHVNRYKTTNATGLVTSNNWRMYLQTAALALALICIVLTVAQVLLVQ